MSQPESDARFAAGVRLFNQGNFFEAHDVWEQVWKNTDGEEKTFYQGLIQAAAALLHAQPGNSVGAISAYLKSRPKLDPVPAVRIGVELGRFRSELAQYFDALRTLLSLVLGKLLAADTRPGLDGRRRGFSRLLKKSSQPASPSVVPPQAGERLCCLSSLGAGCPQGPQPGVAATSVVSVRSISSSSAVPEQTAGFI